MNENQHKSFYEHHREEIESGGFFCSLSGLKDPGFRELKYASSLCCPKDKNGVPKIKISGCIGRVFLFKIFAVFESLPLKGSTD